MRYDLDAVRLDQVIAPPYDVISSSERVTLANRSPLNSVHVELPEPDLAAGLDRYQVASALLAKWIGEGTVVRDRTPALYPYSMTVPGGRTSTGVIGALVIGPDGVDDDILPHEETLPRARTDRLDLLRATRTNLSPIWGLSMAPGLTAAITRRGEPIGDAFDDDGVRHRIWLVDDADAIDVVRRAVASAPLVIADGHHRYQTARTYRDEVREANGDRAGDHDLIMTLVVELSDEQLTVGAIHRTIVGLPDRFDIPGAFERWFDVVRAGPPDARVVGALDDSGALGLVTGDGAWMLTPREGTYEAAGSDLDASLVALVLADLPRHETSHPHTADQAVRAVSDGSAQAAVLLRPPTVAQITEWAAARRQMPPKTTYFTPKPRTGMVFRPVDG
jgi:uncharacterized protein (DUF1015 family)